MASTTDSAPRAGRSVVLFDLLTHNNQLISAGESAWLIFISALVIDGFRRFGVREQWIWCHGSSAFGIWRFGMMDLVLRLLGLFGVSAFDNVLSAFGFQL